MLRPVAKMIVAVALLALAVSPAFAQTVAGDAGAKVSTYPPWPSAARVGFFTSTICLSNPIAFFTAPARADTDS